MAMRVRVCRLGEVGEGEMRDFAVEGIGVPILVTRVEGRLFAGSSMCPHEDVHLSGGSLVEHAIRCPGHGYEFDLATGVCSHDPGLLWKTYEITVVDQDVYVDLL